MYHNYGKMCKITAIVLFWLLAIAGVGSGAAMILMGTVGEDLFMWLGLAASVSGVGLAWLSSIALYRQYRTELAVQIRSQIFRQIV